MTRALPCAALAVMLTACPAPDPRPDPTPAPEWPDEPAPPVVRDTLSSGRGPVEVR